jgi:hypothetical protein
MAIAIPPTQSPRSLGTTLHSDIQDKATHYQVLPASNRTLRSMRLEVQCSPCVRDTLPQCLEKTRSDA